MDNESFLLLLLLKLLKYFAFTPKVYICMFCTCQSIFENSSFLG